MSPTISGQPITIIPIIQAVDPPAITGLYNANIQVKFNNAVKTRVLGVSSDGLSFYLDTIKLSNSVVTSIPALITFASAIVNYSTKRDSLLNDLTFQNLLIAP